MATTACETDSLVGACPERGWKARLVAQFGRPSGAAGWAAGRIMALKNRGRGRWVVSLLNVGPEDRVLEIGFGPGADLARVAELASHGRVAGVDHSPAMVKMARAAVPGADLREAAAEKLPFADGAFDKVFAINSVQFWRDRPAAYREVLRVLRPGGLVALALESHGAVSREAAVGNGRRLIAEMEDAGMKGLVLEVAELGKIPTVCALGCRGG